MMHLIMYDFNSVEKTFQYDPAKSLSGKGQDTSVPEGAASSVNWGLKVPTLNHELNEFKINHQRNLIVYLILHY